MAYYKKALYSRIYNKIKFDPVEKFAFVITLCIATLFSFFSCVECYASEDDNKEQVYFQTLENTVLSGNMIISENEAFDIYYLELQKGYVYYITLSYTGEGRIAYSDSLGVGSPIYNLIRYNNPGTLNLTIYGDDVNYLYFNFSSQQTPTYTIYREATGGYNSAVNDLVENVGVNQIWEVFENGVSFVGVVVLVAFGLFLVVLAIKKVSKGKSEF